MSLQAFAYRVVDDEAEPLAVGIGLISGRRPRSGAFLLFLRVIYRHFNTF